MICGASQIKDLKFKSVSVIVLSIGDISRVLVSWQLQPTGQDLRSVKFHIERGESPNYFETLNAIGINAYAIYDYVDYTALIYDLHKIYYYRVKATEYAADGTPLQNFYSEPTTWDGDLDYTAMYIVEENMFAHRWVYGVPVMVFKKIHDGTYCPACWDNILKRVTKSHCVDCYGTGRLGGYYPPIEVWMKIRPDPKAEFVTDIKLKQISQTSGEIANYPILSPDDIVVELKNNRYWKVASVQYTEKNRTITLQFPQLHVVNLSDIEYHLEVPEDRRIALVRQLEDREKEREF